jgi:hypothetical protein
MGLVSERSGDTSEGVGQPCRAGRAQGKFSFPFEFLFQEAWAQALFARYVERFP